MSRVPLGKVLLRNVIRHTDAHNKIQEESEMWKLRDMERQSSSTGASKPRWMTSSHLSRSSMHCDRDVEDSEGSGRGRLGEKSCLSERDEREARYWTRKLYEFEANDPDRWGHSGFKELYPEEFQSDGETGCTKRSRKNAKEKSPRNSKKSSKRKKKKKKRQRTADSDSESDGSETDDARRKQKRKSGKTKHSRKKKHKRKVKEEDGSSDDSESDRCGEITRRKRHRTAGDSQREPERKKRKNWKVNEKKSDESSED